MNTTGSQTSMRTTSEDAAHAADMTKYYGAQRSNLGGNIMSGLGTMSKSGSGGSWLKKSLKVSVASWCLVGAVASSGAATELITNGNFETGTLAGWSVLSSNANGLWSVVGGACTGSFQARSSETGPTGHVLYQDIAIPAGSSATATWNQRPITSRTYTFPNPPFPAYDDPQRVEYFSVEVWNTSNVSQEILYTTKGPASQTTARPAPGKPRI